MKITKLKQSNVKVVKSTQPGRVGVKETFEHIVKPRGGNGESKDPKPPRGAPKWFQDFEERNNERFKQINNRFIQIDNRFEQIDNRFEQIDSRFKQIDNRLNKLEK